MRTAPLLAVLVGCAAPPLELAPPVETATAPPSYELFYGEEDAAEATRLRAVLGQGIRTVENFFGQPFPESFAVELIPDRLSFTAAFPPEWGMPDTECWMVATGVADFLLLLSPRVWRTDACEHDPDDPVHLRNLVTHELVHVFHCQNNPTRDFTGAEEVGWFGEGLATYVSGQLEEGHVAEAREAVEAGLVPEHLEQAWSGPYRYGVTGSIARFLDRRLGRDVVIELLAVTNQADFLALTGMSEDELLAEWADAVLRGDA